MLETLEAACNTQTPRSQEAGCAGQRREHPSGMHDCQAGALQWLGTLAAPTY